MKFSTGILFSLLAFIPSAFGASPVTLRVAAASDLQFAMPDLVRSFEASFPEIKIEAIYGSSGNFAAQIEQGAPFDLFFSADSAYTQTLVQKGLVEGSRVFEYAQGTLVLWVAKTSTLDIEKSGLSALTQPAVRKIAIANPAYAPYGRAAVAALKSANVYDSVHGKLVLGENVTQALQFAETGAADAALTARSLAESREAKSSGHYVPVDPASYPAIHQSAAVLKASAHAEAAQTFERFMKSDEAKHILAHFGFTAGK